MFSWYRNARECYAFLGDVRGVSEWRESCWWTRGWTLQELIAPSNVTFYDCGWQRIGTKAQWSREIAELTRVPEKILRGEKSWNDWTVAQRFSWAAGRQTKKIEDRAYSLLGLFQINLPLIYGEGNRAFRRLQLEILQKYPDDSVLAWQSGRHAGPQRALTTSHVLATSPDDFASCTDMQPMSLLDHDPPMFSPPRVTSWGIKLRTNAHKLRPRNQTSKLIDDQNHRFLWALRMTVAWQGQFEELPCVLILAQSRPARYNYRRVRCVHQPWSTAYSELSKTYVIHRLESKKLFYLQFDTDLDA